MTHISIDIETYSSVPIAKAGAYKYVQSPDFEILLFAYSVDGGPVEIVDLAAAGMVVQRSEQSRLHQTRIQCGIRVVLPLEVLRTSAAGGPVAGHDASRPLLRLYGRLGRNR